MLFSSFLRLPNQGWYPVNKTRQNSASFRPIKKKMEKTKTRMNLVLFQGDCELELELDTNSP